MMRYLGKRFFFYERYSPIMKRITENIINSKNQKNTNNKNIINERSSSSVVKAKLYTEFIFHLFLRN